MNNEEAANELAEVFKKAITECLDDVIQQRCYLVILEVLKSIEKKNEIKNKTGTTQ